MPLIKSASQDAFKSNLKAELSAGKPRAQALAIAYATQRRHRAGGGPNVMPHLNHSAIPSVRMPSANFHVGPIRAPVAGRTDQIPMKVPGNSYVLPADVVSHLGQNNSEAGHQVVNRLFPSGGPFGTTLPNAGHHGMGIPKPPHLPQLHGGGVPTDGDEGVDIIAAGGEHVLGPDQVAFAGDGDVKRGHETLDKFVKLIRKKHIETLKKLPGPVRDGTK